MSFYIPGGGFGGGIGGGFGGNGPSWRRKPMGSRRNVSPWSSMYGGSSNIGGNFGNFGRNIGGLGGFVPRGFMNVRTSPFERTSNLMPQMDIFDPFNQIDRMMNRSLRWIDRSIGKEWIPQQQQQARQQQQQRPRQNIQQQQRQQQQQRPRQNIQQQQQLPFVQKQKTTSRSSSRSFSSSCGDIGNTAMPQKLRVSVDCVKFDPNCITPQVQTIQNRKHLVLTCKDKRGGQTFRRTFKLPDNVKHDKLNCFLGDNNQFVCEFPFLELPTSLDLDLSPTCVGEGKSKQVMVETRIPEFINPLSVNVCVKGHELIIRFEDKCAKPNCVSRAYYYNRVTLPINADLTNIQCVQKKSLLTIRAPIISTLKGGFRQVPIHRKLRHRLVQKLQEQSTLSMKTTQQQKQQQQQKNKTSVQKVVGGWEQITPEELQEQRGKLHKVTSQQKLPKTSSTSQLSQKQQQMGGKSWQQGNIPGQLGKMEKKNVGVSQTTSTTQRRMGADLLYDVFGTSTPGKSKQQQWQSTTSTGQTGGIKGQQVDENIQQEQSGTKKKKKNKSKTGQQPSGVCSGSESNLVNIGESGGGNKSPTKISPSGSKSNLRSSPQRDVNLQTSQSQSRLNQ